MLPRIIPCFHSFGTCPTQFATDLSRALRYTGTLVPFVLHHQGPYVEAARNRLVRDFLSTEGTHMLMLDVDISFEADAFLKTFTIAEQAGADVLFGNYALGNAANSIFGSPENISQESAVLVNLEPNHVYNDICTGGTGWLLARRALLERMERECPGPWHWFNRDPTTDGKDLRGEDISFGLRLWNMVPRPRVFGTTAVLLRHMKTIPLIPEHMIPEAKNSTTPALAFPNPYEQDKDRYLITGHTVIDKTTLTPAQLEEVERIAKGDSNAGGDGKEAEKESTPEGA